MGHLINPVGFRLTYFNTWVDSWSCEKEFLYSELFHSTNDCKKVLNFFLESNFFEKYGLICSHYTIENNHKFGFMMKCFLYDSVSENKMSKFMYVIDTYNKETDIYYRFFLKKFKYKNNIGYKVKMFNKWKYYDYVLAKKLILFLTYLLVEEGGFSDEIKDFIKEFFFQKFDRFWRNFLRLYKNSSRNTNFLVLDVLKLYILRMIKSLVKRFPLFFDTNSDNVNTFNCNIFINILHLSYLIWWRYQKYYNYMYIGVFKSNVGNNFNLKKYIDYNDSCNRYIIFFFSLFYRLYLIWYRQVDFFKFIKKVLLSYLNKVSLVPLDLEFLGISNDTVTSIFLAKFLIKKLEQRFKLADLFGPISDDLRYIMENGSLIEGYKLQFVGRLSRRDRVRTVWLSGGNLPLTSISKNVEHSFVLGILKNGICCVRVWLYKTKPYNSNNLYKYKINTF